MRRGRCREKEDEEGEKKTNSQQLSVYVEQVLQRSPDSVEGTTVVQILRSRPGKSLTLGATFSKLLLLVVRVLTKQASSPPPVFISSSQLITPMLGYSYTNYRKRNIIAT